MHQDQDHGPRRVLGQREAGKTAVLVVENNPTIRGMLHMMLDLEGYPVRAVADGAEALRELGAIREPRVVLLNESLPDVDGAQMLSTASSHPTLRRHRYVLMSTCASCEVQRSVAPHAGLLLKPFSVEELLDVVENAASDLQSDSPSPLAQFTPRDSSDTPSVQAALPQLRRGMWPALSASLVADACRSHHRGVCRGCYAHRRCPRKTPMVSWTARSPAHR